MPRRTTQVLAASSLILATGALAQPISTPEKPAVLAPFDIVESRVTTTGNDVVFRIRVRDGAGEAKLQVPLRIEPKRERGLGFA